MDHSCKSHSLMDGMDGMDGKQHIYHSLAWYGPLLTAPTIQLKKYNNCFPLILIRATLMKSREKGRTRRQTQTAKLEHPQSQNLAIRHREPSPDHLHFYLRTDLDNSQRIRVKTKQLEQQMIKIEQGLQEELQMLLKKPRGDEVWKKHQRLLLTQLYRFKESSEDELLEEYGRLIQAAQLLCSKLRNNEKVQDFLYFLQQHDFILFFKSLFGKPYTLCNRAHFRKIVAGLWERHSIPNIKAEGILEDIKVWAHGIQLPVNPASIHLHAQVFNNPQTLKKDACSQNNQCCYCNIDIADCLGLTPLLLAVHSNRHLAYEPAIKAGASLFKCPLTASKGPNQTEKQVHKGTTQVIRVRYPWAQRQQFNPIEVLLEHKQYQQIVNLFSFEEATRVKEMKKNRQHIYERLSRVPDCCFQVHWKAVSTKFISFKNLPRDVIVVYKKAGCLRVDYHLDDLDSPTAGGNFSILLRTFEGDRKLQYQLISHHDKKIFDLTREVDSNKIKMRYEQFIKCGSIEDQTLTAIEASIHTPRHPQNETYKIQTEISGEFAFERVIKADLWPFKSVNEYKSSLYSSQVIDYGAIESSEVAALLGQSIGKLPKVQSKQINSRMSMKIKWVSQKIVLKDLLDMLTLLEKKSIFFIKIEKLLGQILNEAAFKGSALGDKLPLSMAIDMGRDFRLEVDIKNLLYCSLDDSVFGVEYRTKTQQYKTENRSINSLQETMLLNESYSIEMSRFLGKTEQLVDNSTEEANAKFNGLMRNELEDDSQGSDEGNKANIIPLGLMD